MEIKVERPGSWGRCGLKKKKDLKRSMIWILRMSSVWPLECIIKWNGRKSLKIFLLSFSRNTFTHVHTCIRFPTQLIFMYISNCENTAHRKIQSIFNNSEYFLSLFPVSIPSLELPLFGFLLPLNILPILNISYKWYQIICILLSLTSSTRYYFVKVIPDIVFFFLFLLLCSI